MESYNIPVIRITNGSVLQYNLPTYRPHRTKEQEDTEKNLTRGKFNGVIAEKSRRKLRRIADHWLLSIQEAKRQKKAHTGKKTRYITFITLTLSSKQRHGDNEIKRELLNPFIIEMKRNYNVQEYIWRAEAQANDNIHFHLFMDSYIHWRQLREVWNKCQERLGYITSFESIHHHSDPNSTDIERIRSVKGASLYVTKYIAKESEYRKLDGRLWGCSDNLRDISAYETIADYEHFNLINDLKNDKKIKHIYDTNYSVHIGDISTFIACHYPSIWKEILANRVQTYKTTYP